jgi:ethanolamine utilization microcompartment shell protein EutS
MKPNKPSKNKTINPATVAPIIAPLFELEEEEVNEVGAITVVTVAPGGRTVVTAEVVVKTSPSELVVISVD